MLMLFDIRLVIVMVFLLSTLLVVLCTIRKFTTFRAYAVGNRQFSTPSLVSTALACYYGGGIMMTHTTKFYYGLYWVGWRCFGIMAAFCVLSWISGRMTQFMYHISMPETMGRVYGKCPRIITALLSVVYSSAVIAIQIYIMSRVINICISSVSPWIITMLATISLVSYATFGGIRAVIFTDIWQSITFCFLICLLAYFMLQQTGCSIIEIISCLSTKKRFFWGTLSPYDSLLKSIVTYLSTLFACIEPVFIQNVYMSSSTLQAKKAFLYAAIFGFMIMFCCTLFGLFTFAWIPPNLSEPDTWHYIMKHIPPFVKGLLATCLLALTMSTADSRLHICAVMISYDILPVIWPKHFRKNSSCLYYYRIAHAAIVIVAIFAVFLALMSNNFWIMSGMLNCYVRFYVPIVVAPFILAILGFRGRPLTALIGMAVGGLAVLVWPSWIAPMVGNINGSLPCMLINGLAMMIAHYILPRSKDRKNSDYSFDELIQPDNQKKSAKKNN